MSALKKPQKVAFNKLFVFFLFYLYNTGFAALGGIQMSLPNTTDPNAAKQGAPIFVGQRRVWPVYALVGMATFHFHFSQNNFKRPRLSRVFFSTVVLYPSPLI